MRVWANQEMISKTHERIRYSKEALIPVWQEKEILTSWSHTRFSATLQIQPSFDVKRQILLARGSLGLLTLLKQIEFDPRKIPRENTWICMLTRSSKDSDISKLLQGEERDPQSQFKSSEIIAIVGTASCSSGLPFTPRVTVRDTSQIPLPNTKVTAWFLVRWCTGVLLLVRKTPREPSSAGGPTVSQIPSTSSKPMAFPAPICSPGFTGGPRKQSSNHSRFGKTSLFQHPAQP